MTLAKELLTIIVCPRCKGDIQPADDGNHLVCRACRLKYPVIDGIPLMLIEEAEPLDET
jgi:hypothetical protein